MNGARSILMAALVVLQLVALGACSDDPLPSARDVPCKDGRAGPFHCRGIDLQAYLPVSELGITAASDVWGWTDPVDDSEYALVGGIERMVVVDITTPTSPDVIAYVPTNGPWIFGESAWRDIKIVGDHAFVSSEAIAHGVQVIDLSALATIDRAGQAVELTPVALYEGTETQPVGHAHNLVSLGEANLIAAVSTESCEGGMHFIDVSTPAAPAFAGCVDTIARVHDAQCVVYNGPDTARVGRHICFAFVNVRDDAPSEPTDEALAARLAIVDVTDLEAPEVLAITSYPDGAFSHQGWLTDDHRFLLGGDESDEIQHGFNTRTLVWDVGNLEAPDFAGGWSHATASTDHNLYVRGDRVYEANYTSGLRVLRLTDLSVPQLELEAFFDTYPRDDDAGFFGAWSVYPWFPSETLIVSSQAEGLFVLIEQGVD